MSNFWGAVQFSPLFFERFETMFIIDVVTVKQTTI